MNGVVMPIQPPETEVVDTWRVACEGSGGALGHPIVWLQIPRETGYVECGYCDRKFIHRSFARDAGSGGDA